MITRKSKEALSIAVGLTFGITATVFAAEEDVECLECRADCARVLSDDYNACLANGYPPIILVCMNIADESNGVCNNICGEGPCGC